MSEDITDIRDIELRIAHAVEAERSRIAVELIHRIHAVGRKTLAAEINGEWDRVAKGVVVLSALRDFVAWLNGVPEE